MRMYIEAPRSLRLQCVQAHALAVAFRAVSQMPRLTTDDNEVRMHLHRYVIDGICRKYLPWVNEHRFVLQRANGTER